MRKTVLLASVIACAVLVSSAHAAVLIDDFNLGGLSKPPLSAGRAIDAGSARPITDPTNETKVGSHFATDVEVRSESTGAQYDSAVPGVTTINFSSRGTQVSFLWDGPSAAADWASDNFSNQFAADLPAADPGDTQFILKAVGTPTPGLFAALSVFQNGVEYSVTEALVNTTVFQFADFVGYDPLAPVDYIRLQIQNPAVVGPVPATATLDFLTSAVPEPATMLAWLGVGGVAGLGYLRRRKARK